MKKILTLLVLVLSLMLSSAFAVTAVFAEEGEETEQKELILEQTDVTDWFLEQNAHYNAETGEYIFTYESQNYTVGTMWYNTSCAQNFAIQFDYFTGSRAAGADGITLTFYSKYNYTDGYWGIELDTYRNNDQGDASYNHIALIRNGVTGHIQVNNLSGYSEDGRWHNLKVEVIDGVCKAYVDGNLFINYEGVAPTGDGWIGIYGATGGERNTHAVKNVKIASSGFNEKYVGATLGSLDVTDAYEGVLEVNQRVIDLTAVTYNSGYATEAKDTKITLNLPEGVELVEGETLTKSVGDIALGASASATWRVKAAVSDIECLKNYTVGIVLSFNSSVIDNSDVMPVVLHKGEQEWATTEHKHVKAYNCCGEVVVAEENHEWENGVCLECEYVCAHLGGQITCTEKAICEECGLYYGEEPIGHVFEGEWTAHEDHNHVKYCFCGEPLVEECEFVIGKENSFCRVCGNTKPLNDYGCDCMATMGVNPMHAMGIGLLALASIVFKFRKK